MPIFARKTGNINTSMFAAPKLALVPASRYYCDITWSYHNVSAKFHLDLKRFRWGPMTLNITRCLFWSKNREYLYFDVCCPETSSCASKPLLLRCNLVIPQCMCPVSLRLKEAQMGAHDFKYNKVALFCSKNREYQFFHVCCPETSSCANKPLLPRCNLVIPQCICQVH